MVQAPVRVTNGPQKVVNKASTRRRMSMVAIGGLIAAFGLDLFLVPSGIIAGGVTGISALASHLTGLHTGMFLFALNLPLLLLAYRRSNREKAVIATVGRLLFPYARSCFSGSALIDSNIGSAGIGGIILGLGIGLGLRYGVVLDTLQMPKMPQRDVTSVNPFKVAIRPYHGQYIRTVIGRTVARLGTSDVLCNRMPDGAGDRTYYDFKPSA